MPVGTAKSEYNTVSSQTDFHKFKVWWKSRFIPSERKYLKKALELLNLNSVDQLVSKTHCASLNDQYWTKQINDNSTWKDINFFTNDFDDSVGLVLLLNREKNFSEKSFNNPDFTTDGALPKRWIIEEGKRYLIKGTDSAFMQEPFNEYLAHVLCSKLGINNVSYQVLQTKNNDGDNATNVISASGIPIIPAIFLAPNNNSKVPTKPITPKVANAILKILCAPFESPTDNLSETNFETAFGTPIDDIVNNNAYI